MPKVYVVEDPKNKNISSATKFGDIEVLLPDSEITFSTGMACRMIRRKLAGFSDEDCLLLIGNPVSIGIAVAIAMDINFGRTKLLKWDNQERIYYLLKADIN